MAITLRYFTEFGKPALQETICGGIYTRVYCIFTAVQCRRKESSRSLSHLLMSFLYVMGLESYRIQWNNTNYTAITLYKVIQSHRLWYQSKTHKLMRLLLLTFILSCTVFKLWLIIGQIFSCDTDRGSLHFNDLAGGDPLRISLWPLPRRKLEWLSYLLLKTVSIPWNG